jgi:hypothetical protein
VILAASTAHVMSIKDMRTQTLSRDMTVADGRDLLSEYNPRNLRNLRFLLRRRNPK